ncbi:hypothetical protein EMCRGX_G012017 [Ephydatia muelleri]
MQLPRHLHNHWISKTIINTTGFIMLVIIIILLKTLRLTITIIVIIIITFRHIWILTNTDITFLTSYNTTVACLMEGFPVASMKQLFVMNFHKGVPIVFNINYHAECPKKRIILNL